MLTLSELFLTPAIFATCYRHHSLLLTLPAAILLTIIVVLTTVAIAQRPITKFYNEHTYTTYTLPEKTCKQLNNMKQALRPEIANLIYETQIYPNEEKTKTLHKLINEREEISQLLNR